jgi:hypothetical protein
MCMHLPLFAQVVLPERETAGGLHQNVFGIGVSGGAASGLGLSFRHHLPSTFSYQITGGIIKVDERLHYAIGGELQFDLSRSGTTRFFVVGAAGYYYAGSSDRNEIAAPGRAGLGLGGEMYSGSGFHGTLELLFTYFSDGTVLPLPQFGLHYYF